MPLTMSKEAKPCSICNNKEGRFKFSEGMLCRNCFIKCSQDIKRNFASKTLDDIEFDLAFQEELLIELEEKKKAYENFNSTLQRGWRYHVNEYIDFDKDKKQWLIPTPKYSNKIPEIYRFDNILSYELVENGETKTKSGIGRAIAGGILFGGAGAIVGAITSNGRYNVVKNLSLHIDTNIPALLKVKLEFITAPVKTNSALYKLKMETAQQTIEILAPIIKENNLKLPRSTSVFCRKCGNKIPSNSFFCNKCGAKIE